MFLLKLLVTLCVLDYGLQQQDNAQQEAAAKRELITAACDIADNRTVREQFFASVREQHGIHRDRRYYAQATYLRTHKIRCYNSCDDAVNITWCANIFHPSRKIEVCLNSTVKNDTTAANIAGIQSHLNLPEDCGNYGTGCLEVVSARYYLNNAYLTCTSENSTCYRKTFVQFSVIVAGYSSESDPPEIDVPDSPLNVTLGETSILLCSVVVKGLNAYSAWQLNGNDYNFIDEDPLCDNSTKACKTDTHPGHQVLKTHRVRAYQTRTVLRSCPVEEINITNYLVIENVTEADAALYQCIVAINILNAWPPRRYSNSTALNISTVLPIIPIVVQDRTDVTLTSDGDISGTAQWTCEVVGSSQDQLEWQYNGTTVPVMVNNDTHTPNCSSLNLVPSSVAAAVLQEQDLGEYKTRYMLTLHLCDATERDVGSYQCVIRRWNGNVDLVWEVRLQTTTVENSPLPTSTAIPTSPVTTPEHAHQPLFVIIPVCVAALLLFIVAAVLIAIILACKRRRSKTAFSDILFQENPYLSQDCIKKERLLPPDPMEFPRARLLLMNRVLGEGTFGKVVQAKAEGIVPGSPERNVVAVKTTKDNASSQCIEDLWDELQLMKRMVPHENILNLLGYCTSPGGPLCLIVEYAIYGNLKGFLQECEQAVRGLNHLPIITRTKSRSNSTSSTSSTYPLLLHEKTPISRQNSVFSDMSNECRKFTFPVPPHRQHLRSQDSGVFGESVEALQTAHAPGMTTPLAHTVAPLSHDYINTKGLVYMEDVLNFALQIACGLQHLNNIQVPVGGICTNLSCMAYVYCDCAIMEAWHRFQLQNVYPQSITDWNVLTIVHCDLAARNILIAEGFVLKIADFGMARDVGEKAYYRKSIGRRVPVKWTAPEALESHLFSYNSDVWSFGVVLWEIFSYGHSPYPDFKINTSWEPFIHHLKEGNRLSCPDGCPDLLYDLMLQCWHLRPDERPSARDLVTALTPQCDGTDSLHSQQSSNSQETTV